MKIYGETELEILLPTDIKHFIDEVVDSFVMWDLLIFFSKKAGELATSDQIAQRLGRPMEEVQKPIKKLEKLELAVLDKLLDGSVNCYINKKSDLFPLFEKFAQYNESQESRLKILSYLLQKKIH